MLEKGNIYTKLEEKLEKKSKVAVFTEPIKIPLNMAEMTAEEIIEAFQKGIDDINAGRHYDSETAKNCYKRK